MSEDRTQSPTKMRRQRAREQGQAAQSPELTGAAALLMAAFLLGVWGQSLAGGLLAIVRASLSGPPIVTIDAPETAAKLRTLALGVAWPLGVVLVGSAAAATAAHQAQVGGLWAPPLLAPNVGRLWGAGGGPGLTTRGARAGWALLKVVALVAVAAWMIRSRWPTVQTLGSLGTESMARACGQALRQTALALAGVTVVLGLADFGLQYVRFEAMLRTTSEEQREDQRSMEGDPALRAQRRRVARSWSGGSAEELATASLVLTGPFGLTVVLSGGPPPRRITVRSMAQGAAGSRLRRAVAKLPQVDAPALARKLARRHAPALPLTAIEADEVAAVWPRDRAVTPVSVWTPGAIGGIVPPHV
jgi:flagellar biosynthetic protein FlhB